MTWGRASSDGSVTVARSAIARGLLRAGVFTATAVAAVLVSTAPTDACEDPSGCPSGGHGSAEVVDNRAVDAHAISWESVRTGTSRSSTASQCVYESINGAEVPMYADMLMRRVIPSSARFYRVQCDEGLWRTGWWVPGSSAVADGAFHDVVQEAVDRLAPGRPELRLTPAADQRHLTGLPTWLAVSSTSWSRLSTTVTAGEVTVRVELRPVGVGWTLGDGLVYACPGPGSVPATDRLVADQTPDCAHTWLFTPAELTGDADTQTFRVVARVSYDARYRVDTPDGSAGGALGRVDGPPRAVDVVVRQYQAVRVAPGT